MYLAQPQAVALIRRLLLYGNVAGCGVGVVNKVLWIYRVEPDAVKESLRLAKQHTLPDVREQAASIRRYLRDRAAVCSRRHL